MSPSDFGPRIYTGRHMHPLLTFIGFCIICKDVPDFFLNT
jgi:hypothetical protein